MGKSVLDQIGDGLRKGVDVIEGLWDDYTGKAANRENVQAQKEMNALNRQWSLEDWDKINAYNHPLQQMNRLKEAGLNPNLVYGKGAENTASMIRSSDAKAPHVAPLNIPPITGALSDIYDIAFKKAQTRNTNSQASLLEKEGILKDLDIRGKTTGNEKAMIDLSIKKALFDTSIESGKARYEGIKLQNDRIAAETTRITADTFLKQYDLANVRPELTKKFKEGVLLLEKQNKLAEFEAQLRDFGLSPTSNAAVSTILRLLQTFLLKR